MDRQNKKIAELEETVRKLESLKTIAESQNLELLRKLKDAEKGGRGTLKRGAQKTEDKDVKESPLVGDVFTFVCLFVEWGCVLEVCLSYTRLMLKL